MYLPQGQRNISRTLTNVPPATQEERKESLKKIYIYKRSSRLQSDMKSNHEMASWGANKNVYCGFMRTNIENTDFLLLILATGNVSEMFSINDSYSANFHRREQIYSRTTSFFYNISIVATHGYVSVQN